MNYTCPQYYFCRRDPRELKYLEREAKRSKLIMYALGCLINELQTKELHYIDLDNILITLKEKNLSSVVSRNRFKIITNI